MMDAIPKTWDEFKERMAESGEGLVCKVAGGWELTPNGYIALAFEAKGCNLSELGLGEIDRTVLHAMAELEAEDRARSARNN